MRICIYLTVIQAVSLFSVLPPLWPELPLLCGMLCFVEFLAGVILDAGRYATTHTHAYTHMCVEDHPSPRRFIAALTNMRAVANKRGETHNFCLKAPWQDIKRRSFTQHMAAAKTTSV